MRLHTKMSAIIFITWAIMFTAVYVGSRIILERSFIQLENRQAMDHLNRALEAMDQMAESVGLIASSNAVWDDAYKFAEDKNEEFIKANLQLTSLVGFGTDMLLFFNAQGQPVYFAVLSKDNKQVIPLPTGFKEYLGPKSKLVNQPNIDSALQGLVSIPEGILLVAAHSIVKGDNTGPVHGTLVAVKYFQEAQMAKLKEVTKLNLTIYLKPDIEKNSEVKRIYDALQTNNYILEKSSDKLWGYALLKDLDDKPFGVIKITMERGIFALGNETIRYFTTAFFIAGFTFLFLLLFFFRRLVTSRLEQLNKQVVDIGETKNFSQRVTEEGQDELTSVETEINNMLDIIQQYNQEITEAEGFVTNIINAMPSALIITDENLNIMRLNSLAEKEAGLTTASAQGKTLIDVFPFLRPYETRFEESVKHNKLHSIEKISQHTSPDNYTYLTAVIYPLNIAGSKYLVTRIDDITDRIKISEKLAQSDKLASLGVLTAGVAHEINNPINFVIATIDPLKDDVTDVLTVLKKYFEIKTAEDFSKQINEIMKLKEEKNIDFTIKEIEDLLGGIKEGASRTARIVNDLKSFTRSDEDAMKKVDLHEGIDSTLTLLKPKYSHRVNIVKEYGEIPKVDCYPGKLNQVFMNILSNAVEAIPKEGEIKIKTFQADDNVVIIIKDSGTGISNENISKVFEPFFTTKDVGKGTGLGLSISFGIIREHNGSIEVKSESGVGTEFIITLPINQPA